MKILFGIKRLEDMPGGAERVLAFVASKFVQDKNDVVVFSWDRPNYESFYTIDENVRRVSIQLGDNKRPTRPLEFLRRIYGSYKLLKKERPDVVVGFCHSMYVPLSFAAALARIPFIASEHAAIARYKGHLVEYTLQHLSALISKCMTIPTAGVREQFSPLLRQKMVVVPNPIMIEPAFNLSRQNRLLLNVGRLVPQKDQETLIRAFGKVSMRHPCWMLKVIGVGPLHGHLTNLVDTLKLKDRVQIVPACKNIWDEYRCADVFILSSIWESLGLVTIEAMSQRLPVIGFSDCPGTNILIKNGKNGLLVNPDECRIDALASAIDYLIKHKDLREEFGRAGESYAMSLAKQSNALDAWKHLLQNVKR